jgi:biotin carboxyl carrier protein
MKKYLITVKGVSYEVEVEEIKGSAVTYKAESPASSQVIPESKIAEPKQAAVKKPEPSNADSKNSISSPMPGTILKVKVKAGDSVKKGDILVILEAMKMENEILAPEDAVVSTVTVTEGSTVSTGDILVAFK